MLYSVVPPGTASASRSRARAREGRGRGTGKLSRSLGVGTSGEAPSGFESEMSSRPRARTRLFARRTARPARDREYHQRHNRPARRGDRARGRHRDDSKEGPGRRAPRSVRCFRANNGERADRGRPGQKKKTRSKRGKRTGSAFEPIRSIGSENKREEKWKSKTTNPHPRALRRPPPPRPFAVRRVQWLVGKRTSSSTSRKHKKLKNAPAVT